MVKHASLFSGIGGFDLAAQWMGWENIFHCEWNEFGQKVLQYYWPNATCYGDITKTDFTIWRNRVDVLSGGFPCQPYSLAGKRLGKEDARHLWPQMLRAIREIQPGYVVGENVFGLTNWNGGLVFEEVCAELEAEGYEVQPSILPAAGVGAPHKRDRVWFVAKNTMRNGCIQREPRKEEPDVWEQRNTGSGSGNGVYLSAGISSYSNHDGLHGTENRQGHHQGNDNYKTRANSVIKSEGCCGSSDDATNSMHNGLQGSLHSGEDCAKGRKDQNRYIEECLSFNGGGIRFDNFPTQSPVCGRNDGVSGELAGITFSKHRSESLKAYGNAIVPQVAYEIFKVINQMLNKEE